ncbi:MAG: hypothetical protein ACM358_11090 [Gemmatimonadota bacterium]
MLGLLAPAAAGAQELPPARTVTVVYLTRDWLFINAGWGEGLRQGSEVEVVRRGRTVAVLRVESVGDRRASCVIVSRQLPLMLGDTVRLLPAAPQPRTAIASPLPRPDSTRPARIAPAPAPAPASASAVPVPAPAPTAREQVAPARSDATPGRTTVTFVTGAEIYVGAGRQEGLTEGASLSVMRRDSVVATLRVKFLASHQSSCEVQRGATAIVVGDTVRFVPAPRPPTTAPGTVATATPRRRPRRLSGPGIHGRVGMRYLRATSALSRDSTGIAPAGTGFDQPSFDLRMSGLSIGGTPIGLTLDLRTRRTVTSATGQPNLVDGHTRVYQAAVFWGAPGAGFRTVAGRQYLTAVTSVSMFDGGLMELNGSRITFGVFGGLEPDPASLGFSDAVQDYGGYLQFHSRPAAVASWAITTGAVGSLQANHANREFGFIQVSVNTPSYALFALQEIDYYPPWKVQLGEKPLSFTSQYATGWFRASRWLAFNASYDNRRSVRLYRDTQNPETAFDDAYRQGYGAGVQLASYKVRLGGDWRRSTGGTAGRADSYTGIFGLDPVTPLKLAASARATWYQNLNDSTLASPIAQRIAGRLYSWWIGCDPVDRLHFDVNGGTRREDNPNTTTMQTSTWYGVAVDVSVARAWFVSVSGLRQKDPASPGTNVTTQLYSSVTWRF